MFFRILQNSNIIRMTKKERLEALIAHYSDGKPTKFAKFLGVAPSTISSWLKRDTYDYELLFAKCESLSAEWLITGKGEMLKQKTSIYDMDISDIISRLERIESKLNSSNFYK